MQALLLKLADQLNGSVFVLLAILLIAFWAIYKLGGIVNMFGLFKEKNKEIDTHIEGIKETLAAIKATTDLLYQAHLSTLQTHSPLGLSQKGTDIANVLKIDEKISNHWDYIKGEIEKRSPTNQYDIQVVSLELARSRFDMIFTETEKAEIKIYSYNVGANLLEILPIVGVKIRDRFLKEKGFTLEQVDLHIPKQ